MSKSPPDIIIFVNEETLSDGSKAYNVAIGNITLHAVTEAEAVELAEKIEEAIDSHCTETCGISYEYDFDQVAS
jgi:hypothetical protein